MKKAILFPGIGYHCDKPLLYYTKKILKQYGYDIQEIVFQNLHFDLEQSKEMAYNQACCQIQNLDSNTLFVSKSIGTYCAGKLAEKYQIQNHIYFTPLKFSKKYITDRDLVFSGTRDPFVSNEDIPIHCYRIENGNHSLETGNIQKDLENLKWICEWVEKFIKERG
ncbi:hypothetical protein [Floccifex sp.]|uniref:hypothetical protein n=1 Tax=Floccifex sp. TaxID=2815810 RepID=UPI003F02B0DB